MAEIILPPDHDYRGASSIGDGLVGIAGKTTGTPYRPNTAAVVRDESSHVYKTSIFSGEHNNFLIEVIAGGDLFDAKESILEINGDPINTIKNTPLAATVVWDNSQINLYYFVPNTDGGAFLEEACQRGDDGWSRGALGQALLDEGVSPHLNSPLAVWTNQEQIHVYFKSTTDGEREITLAKYFPDNSTWNVKNIRVSV